VRSRAYRCTGRCFFAALLSAVIVRGIGEHNRARLDYFQTQKGA
jgi:hypothetical protein